MDLDTKIVHLSVLGWVPVREGMIYSLIRGDGLQVWSSGPAHFPIVDRYQFERPREALMSSVGFNALDWDQIPTTRLRLLVCRAMEIENGK